MSEADRGMAALGPRAAVTITHAGSNRNGSLTLPFRSSGSFPDPTGTFFMCGPGREPLTHAQHSHLVVGKQCDAVMTLQEQYLTYTREGLHTPFWFMKRGGQPFRMFCRAYAL
jgi:hypothetical protein